MSRGLGDVYKRQDSYRTVMRAWVVDAYGPNASKNPVHALERGECAGAEFEQILAARLLRSDGGLATGIVGGGRVCLVGWVRLVGRVWCGG